jgi:hypothetical protein
MQLLKAISLIESYNNDFDEIIEYYMRNGYVYVSPECFILAEYNSNEKDLFVYLCIGEIKDLMNKIHFSPETISFTRKGKLKKYLYERFYNKVKKIK